MDAARDVAAAVAEVADRFAAQRPQRQGRRALDRADFAELAAAGFLRTGLPAERGGLWTGLATTTRTVCELLRVLAQGDPSVALVAAMHPGVLSLWLAPPDGAGDDPAWAAQCEEVFAAVEAGSWFGTITSEPGSGGDVTRTRATARPLPDGRWAISGQKHFGSG
ncbi:MAG: hypothetical protein AB7L84_15190, partial [Acidimicrobiia bacterium]